MRFDQWYKRRINRIYPSIIATAIVVYIVWHFEENIVDILIGKRYWFIGCIMVYYIFLFPLKQIKNEKIVNWLFVSWLVIIIVFFFVIWKGQASLYSRGLYRCLLFFLFMLQGALMGKHHDAFSAKWWHWILLLAATALWFYLVYIWKDNPMIMFSIIPLLCVTHSLYCVSNAGFLTRLYDTSFGRWFLFPVSQLCLEVYLIQKFIFTDKYNYLFPLNVPIIMLLVIIAAYLIKVLAEFISQTFKTEPYDWNRMFVINR